MPDADDQRGDRRELERLVEEFVALNRRRLSAEPPLAPGERRRWTELRWRIEELLGGASHPGERIRCALRVPTRLDAEVSDGHGRGASRVTEIAEGGLFLASDAPAAPGTPVQLRIRGEDGEQVEVRGTVAWARGPGSPQGAPGMGVRFEGLDAAQLEGVAELVAQALSAL